MPQKAKGTQGPFFHLDSTKLLIEELSALESVAIYVGAGASIERTGLTWEALSAQMLDPQLGDFPSRVEIVRNASSTLAVSSAIAQQFREERATNWRDYLSRAIHDQLYAGPAEQTAYFIDRVVSLASAYIRAGKSAVIVTPNYDRFLLDAVEEQRKRFDNAYDDVAVFRLGVNADGLPTKLDEVLPKLHESLKSQRTLTLVFLHGYVDRDVSSTSSESETFPVVSEEDYAATRENSQSILGEIFTGRSTIIVGSSVTDPPLIHALLESRTEKASKRYVIRPLQGQHAGSLTASARKHLVEIEERRARHLGIDLVSPPFYYQAPQILEEVRVDLAAATASHKYSEANADHRYGARLLRWWDDWSKADGEDIEKQQEQHYRFLRNEALPRLRQILKAKRGENLKLEAWVRWEPESRRLALWASSTGSWPEHRTMRDDAISANTQITAIKAFVNGAPTYEKGDPAHTRWGSYLAKPIRAIDPRYNVYVPVGVICVASMRPQDRSALNPRIQENRAELLVLLDTIGTAVFAPHTSLINWDATLQPTLV